MTATRGSYNSDSNPMFDHELDRNPPVIRWAKNNRGVWVAVEVRDPHAERGFEAQQERMRANADRMEQEEARQAAVRAEQRRLDNTRLLISARTEI